MITVFKYSTGYKGQLYRFEDRSRDIVLEKVVEFMQKNNIIFNREDLLRSIDRQSAIASTKKKRVTLGDAVNGAKALIKYTSSNRISTEELTRRSTICSQCPMINRLGGCMSCGAAGAIARFVNKIRSSYNLEIQIPSEVRQSYCGVCECSLALMVVTHINDFHESAEKNAMRPDCCWMKTISYNFIQP